MPEAVIVATARSPIGRAGKGSLDEHAPRRPGRADGARRAGQGAAARPADIDDLMLGCGLPGGEQGFNMARVVAVLLGLRPPARHHGQPVLLVVAADHPDGVPRDQGRRGRRVHLGRRRDACRRFAKGSSDAWPDTHNPVFADAEAAHRSGRGRAAGELARPARGRRAARHLHRDGPDRRERRPAAAASPARSMDEFGVRSQNLAEKAIANGFFAARDHPGHAARRHRGQHRRRPAAPAPRCETVAALKPVFRPDGTVTAGNCCPLNDGAAAVVVMSDTKAAELGITPLARIVSTGRDRRCPRRSWASARSRRPGRRWPGPG